MSDGNNDMGAARSFLVKHWQIIVAVIGIVWVGGADAQQLKSAQTNIGQAQADIAATREQYANLKGEIGKVQGELTTLTTLLRPTLPMP